MILFENEIVLSSIFSRVFVLSGPRPSYPVLLPRPHKSFNQLNLLLGKVQSLWSCAHYFQWFTGYLNYCFTYVTGTCFKETAIFYLFGFTLFTVDLKLLIYTKNSLYSLYSNNIVLIDVNSALNRRWNLSQKNFSNQCEQACRQTHICSHIDQRNSQSNASITVQWVFWCSLYKSYMLQIYFTKPTRTLQRHPFFNFSFKNA